MDTKQPTSTVENEQQDIIAKFKKHKSRIITASVIVAVLCVGALVWYFIALEGARKADEAVALADTELNDSIALNLYQQAAKLGYKSGDRAALNAGIILYRQGKYQEALADLSKTSSKSSIIEAGRLSLMGDCNANLGNLDEAIKCFKKAYNAADMNPEIAPFILIKEANVYREMGHFDEEHNCLTTIQKEYPEYLQSLSDRRTDLRKYIERAKAQTKK